jgi:two-component system osmolarity sensor histidine kinase EnvZ
MGFNRMARELAKVEEDRAVMLAGISHDLRTPLARLRLEAEMSVADEEAKRNMASRHRPARRHHRQVHGLRPPGRTQAAPVPWPS